jgi:hypothetical protein
MTLIASRSIRGALCAAMFLVASRAAGEDRIAPDLSGLDPVSGIEARHEGDRLVIVWPMGDRENGRLALNLARPGPLIASLGILGQPRTEPLEVLRDADPAAFLTIGSRVAAPGKPPGMSPFNEFFDSPAKRPHATHAGKLDLREARVTSSGRRATVTLGTLTLGPFRGTWQFTVYGGSPLVHLEAVVRTDEDGRAILYDLGLVQAEPRWRSIAWMDTEGMLRRQEPVLNQDDRAIAARHRAIVAEAQDGSIACFPPPHQFFDPRDYTDNLSTTWLGRNHRGLEDRFGFGVKQSESGGGAFAPWFNAPPGTDQRLGAFFLLDRGDAGKALEGSLRYTNRDRFPDLPGHLTFTSHWHMAIAVAALEEQARGGPRSTPDFVRMFKDMNVQMVHLAEFHGDGHPRDPGPLRIAELNAMFDDCRRLSDRELLLIPGEEANVHLGVNHPGAHPGHWIYLFPRPVTWIMKREAGQPFVEDRPDAGPLYRVGDRDEMLDLLRREHGLAWTAHARIKASSWAPDYYRHEPFYLSDRWLGAAWKAMPADLSRPKLGERVLDLLDDMANWGRRKYVIGEVDVFKLDHTHELYGHMNVNYVRMDRLPRFDEGWRPLLDALRGGRFFVTTGEVLIEDYRVGGRRSGESLSGLRPALEAKLRWTFPLRFAEVIAGDGRDVERTRIDLSDTESFGQRTIRRELDLAGKRWVRIEVWDVAGNGAFTQPVWLEAR